MTYYFLDYYNNDETENHIKLGSTRTHLIPSELIRTQILYFVPHTKG